MQKNTDHFYSKDFERDKGGKVKAPLKSQGGQLYILWMLHILARCLKP